MSNNVLVPNPGISADQAFPLEKEIVVWDIKTAVDRVRPKIESFKRSAADIAKDLWIAHEVLARRGGDRKTAASEEIFTWTDFCDMIGLSRKMATLYAGLYDPVEDRVRQPEEMRALKSANLQIDNKGERESRIVHAVETGIRLPPWTAEDEKEFKTRMANKRFAELADKWGSKKIKTSWKKDKDYFSEAMANAKQYARLNLQTKEQTKAQWEIFEQISEYLKTFADPAIRLAAAYNMGLRIRGIVNDIAGMEAELQGFDAVSVDTSDFGDDNE